MTVPPFTAPLDLAKIPRGELAEKLDIVLTEVSAERLVATMPVHGNRQPFGLLHGGASAVLAETLGSLHAALLAGPEGKPVGIELSCTHHRSAREGSVTATCTPLHTGRRMQTFHITVRDDADRAVCTARLTCFLPSA